MKKSKLKSYINSLTEMLRAAHAANASVVEDRDYWRKRYEESEREIMILNQEQDAAYGRGLLEGANRTGQRAAAEYNREPRPGMIGGGALAPEEVPHEPVAKSAIEVPKPETDEGEGMVIAHMTVAELKPGMRFRFGDGKQFETLTRIEHDVTSDSIFDDERATIKLSVKWGGSGYFRPDRIVQVDSGTFDV